MALGDDEMLTTEGIQRMCQIVLNETIVSYNSILTHITHITSQGQDVLKTGILYSNRTPEPHHSCSTIQTKDTRNHTGQL